MMRGKVVLVPFPFDDLIAAKVRPAVCLTEPIGPYGHIVLAFITSRIPSDLLESDIVVESTQPDFSSTGLHVPSTVRLHRLMTLPIGLIQRELGELPVRLQKEVNEKLQKMFCLM